MTLKQTYVVFLFFLIRPAKILYMGGWGHKIKKNETIFIY